MDLIPIDFAPSYEAGLDTKKILYLKSHRYKPNKKRVKLSVWLGVILVTLSAAAYPVMPMVMYKINPPEVSETETLPATYTANDGENSVNTSRAEEIGSSNRTPESRNTASAATTQERTNRLVIPKIDVDIEIIGGNNAEYAWSKGAWHQPGTSSPDNGGNMALSAHRFRYQPPHTETFYLLDKLETGDHFFIYWEGKVYKYKVKKEEVVSPYATEILEPTEEPVATLYTCAPLFSTENRLYVRGELMSIN